MNGATTNGSATNCTTSHEDSANNSVSNGHTESPSKSLAGKVALVTGASRGIGAGIALELGSRGASVVVNYVKTKSSADEVVQQIEMFGSKAIAIQADVSKISEITRLFEECKTHFGKIDIVMSNSGTESFDKTEDITEERFDYVFGLNIRAQFFVGQHAYKYCEDGGRLILMSSIAAGLLGVRDHALYSGSKSAVNGITKSFATDFGKKGMTCNAIAPGGVKSDMFTEVAWRYIPGADRTWSANAIETAMANHCPMGRCALPVDVARVVAFLASEDAGWVNGKKFQPPLNLSWKSLLTLVSSRPNNYYFWWFWPVAILDMLHLDSNVITINLNIHLLSKNCNKSSTCFSFANLQKFDNITKILVQIGRQRSVNATFILLRL